MKRSSKLSRRRKPKNKDINFNSKIHSESIKPSRTTMGILEKGSDRSGTADCENCLTTEAK